MAQAEASEPAATINWVPLFLGFGGMALGQFMSILDIQIVSASLPQIQAGVGASNDQISWVQSAYLIPEVVMIPLSAFLSRVWGTQKIYLASCLGFLVMSVIAGFSTSVDMLIISRGLQGFIGGAMIPTVFATAFTAFPPERRVTANVVTSMIVTLAPTIGPTFGGHLTEWLNWRWLFFINVGPGLLSLFLVGRYGNFDKGDRSLSEGFDWLGLFSMAVFLLSMQYVIEEGAKESWFKDDLILWLTVLAVCSGVFFVHRQLSSDRPIVQLKAFANRNFATGIVMTSVSGTALYGGTFLMPLYLGRIRHFSAAEVGTTMLVSGLTMFLTAPIIGRFVRNLDPRIPIVFGFSLVALGMWQGNYITENWGFAEFAVLQVLRGVGVMTAMVATSQMTMGSLPPAMIKDASGLVNLSRNVGGAIGLAVLSSVLGKQTAVHTSELTARISWSDLKGQEMLHNMTFMMANGGSLDPAGGARKAFMFMIHNQAQVLAFGDAFAVMTACAVVAALLGLTTRPVSLNIPQVASETH